MKEIRIVLNNDPETFRGNEFSIYIDDVELKRVKSFSLDAVKPDPNDNEVDLDQIITYTADFAAEYFENDDKVSSEWHYNAPLNKDYDYFIGQLTKDNSFHEMIRSITYDKLTKKTNKDSSKWEQEV